LIALIGANGIGKSTLLPIYRNSKPLEGTVFLNNKISEYQPLE
jgi:ABC-type cobalamin/Fe3+-siderophores transport system ATPase subunit